MTNVWAMNLHALARLGVNYADAVLIHRDARRLRRWFELECGDGDHHSSWAIERDPETDKPYRCIYPHTGDSYRVPVADQEKAARKRLASTMGRYPDLGYFIQSDPRGGPIGIYRKADVPKGINAREWAACNGTRIA